LKAQVYKYLYLSDDIGSVLVATYVSH